MGSGIHFYSNEVKSPLRQKKKASGWIEGAVLDHKKYVGNVSINFCRDEFLLEINLKHLNHNYLTDIITFNYNEEDVISGDIFISIDRIKENAKKYNCKIKDELNRIMIHGILHLLGYDDNTERQKAVMREKEDYYLSLRSF